MNHDQHNNDATSDSLEREEEALKALPSVMPASEALELTRQAVRVELEMDWLRRSSPDPQPAYQVLAMARQAVRDQLRKQSARPLQKHRRQRVWQLWIPASLAASLLLVVGYPLMFPKPLTTGDNAAIFVSSTLDDEFQNDWAQLASLEASLDEVESNLNWPNGRRSRHADSSALDMQLEELSDELAGLEDVT